jgi:hypothetical protein
MIPKTVIPKRNDKITEKILDDEIILYNNKTHTIHSLNQTAGLLWALCDGKMTTMQMIEMLQEKYKGSKKSIEKDVLKTLEEMETNNLITL